jgi:hypothetical protein
MNEPNMPDNKPENQAVENGSEWRVFPTVRRINTLCLTHGLIGPGMPDGGYVYGNEYRLARLAACANFCRGVSDDLLAQMESLENLRKIHAETCTQLTHSLESKRQRLEQIEGLEKALAANSQPSPPIYGMTAKQMFQIVYGPGTAGSEFEFDCQNPVVRSGWMRLAAVVSGLKSGALLVAEQKCKEACGDSAPSAGHDYFDEVCGLLRVTRGQRDDASRQLQSAQEKLNAMEAQIATNKAAREWIEKYGETARIALIKSTGYSELSTNPMIRELRALILQEEKK